MVSIMNKIFLDNSLALSWDPSIAMKWMMERQVYRLQPCSLKYCSLGESKEDKKSKSVCETPDKLQRISRNSDQGSRDVTEINQLSQASDQNEAPLKIADDLPTEKKVLKTSEKVTKGILSEVSKEDCDIAHQSKIIETPLLVRERYIPPKRIPPGGHCSQLW